VTTQNPCKQATPHEEVAAAWAELKKARNAGDVRAARAAERRMNAALERSRATSSDGRQEP
jgi:hypothetical protein